jgi:hypothetical protein
MTTRNKRPNGAGYLFKRGKYYCYRYMINGKSKQVSLKTTRKAEAERIVSQDYLPLIQARSIEGIALHVKEVKASKTQKKTLLLGTNPHSKYLVNGLLLISQE